MPAESLPAVAGSVSAAQSRYESLRRQALGSLSLTSGDGLELGFIERQGLAAWLARGSESLTNRTVSLNSPTDAPAKAHPPDRDLIVVLTDLLLGDRGEESDGRRS